MWVLAGGRQLWGHRRMGTCGGGVALTLSWWSTNVFSSAMPIFCIQDHRHHTPHETAAQQALPNPIPIPPQLSTCIDYQARHNTQQCFEDDVIFKRWSFIELASSFTIFYATVMCEDVVIIVLDFWPRSCVQIFWPELPLPSILLHCPFPSPDAKCPRRTAVKK